MRKWDKLVGEERLKMYFNGRNYQLLTYCELSAKWQKVAEKEYEYLGVFEDTGLYFIYRNSLYNLSDFIITQKDTSYTTPTGRTFKPHGYKGDSYFSGVAVQLDKHGESVKVAEFIS